jgi:hypothetical protein
MLPLQRLSPRTEFVVDAWAFRLFDPVSKTCVGRGQPFGRERVVSVLPMRNGPPQRLLPEKIVNDVWNFPLSDPSGNLIGRPAVIIHRLLSARWTEDTRGLSG